MLTEKQLKEKKDLLCSPAVVLFSLHGNRLCYSPLLEVYIIKYNTREDDFWTFNENQAVEEWNRVVKKSNNLFKQLNQISC